MICFCMSSRIYHHIFDMYGVLFLNFDALWMRVYCAFITQAEFMPYKVYVSWLNGKWLSKLYLGCEIKVWLWVLWKIFGKVLKVKMFTNIKIPHWWRHVFCPCWKTVEDESVGHQFCNLKQDVIQRLFRGVQSFSRNQQ